MSGKLLWTVLLLLGSQYVASVELDDLTDRFFAWRLDNSPEFGTKFGINNHDDKVEVYTEEAFAKQKEEAEEFLAEAEEISVDGLDLQDKISLAILKDLLNNFIDGYKFREYSLYNGISTIEYPFAEWKSLISWSKFNTEADYNHYLARLNLLPQQLDQKQNLMQIAIDKGLTQPLEALTGVLTSTQAEVDSVVEDSAFYAPFKKIPDAIAENVRTRLQSDGQNVINTKVHPAFQNYVNFVNLTYVPNARPRLGASSLPNGSEYYAACLRWHLSVDMTPQEIHDIGLQEVDRINKQMEKIMESEGFEGSLQEYKAHLEEDPTNYFNTSEELLQAYRDFIAETHDKLGTILNNVPDMEISVVASDNPYGTVGRYTEPPLDNSRPGTFIANVFFPDQRPKFNVYALSLHEAEPGHHTQTAITIENEVSDFRRAIEYRKYAGVPFNWLFHTSYSEGWALYAEALGEEMGAYTAKHAMFGRYASEILRAARLVVDTGIHSMGWSHERAVNYLAEHSTISRNSVQNEINRYTAWPGQACAYKIGELKIKELKKNAMDKLGDAFDLRAFHDQVLLLGNAPLHVLENHISTWIDDNTTPSAAVSLTATVLWIQLVIVLLSSTLV